MEKFQLQHLIPRQLKIQLIIILNAQYKIALHAHNNIARSFQFRLFNAKHNLNKSKVTGVMKYQAINFRQYC